jgi:hypothetical protein
MCSLGGGPAERTVHAAHAPPGAPRGVVDRSGIVSRVAAPTSQARDVTPARPAPAAGHPWSLASRAAFASSRASQRRNDR